MFRQFLHGVSVFISPKFSLPLPPSSESYHSHRHINRLSVYQRSDHSTGRMSFPVRDVFSSEINWENFSFPQSQKRTNSIWREHRGGNNFIRVQQHWPPLVGMAQLKVERNGTWGLTMKGAVRTFDRLKSREGKCMLTTYPKIVRGWSCRRLYILLFVLTSERKNLSMKSMQHNLFVFRSFHEPVFFLG